MKRLIAIFLISLTTVPYVFAGTETLVCNYEKYSDSDGSHKVKDKFVLTFILDNEKGTAYMLGNQGSTEVNLIPSAGGLTFVEITGSGNVMTTTVDKKASSVHSRNTVIAEELVPTQYYGKCVFK